MRILALIGGLWIAYHVLATGFRALHDPVSPHFSLQVENNTSENVRVHVSIIEPNGNLRNSLQTYHAALIGFSDNVSLGIDQGESALVNLKVDAYPEMIVLAVACKEDEMNSDEPQVALKVITWPRNEQKNGMPLYKDFQSPTGWPLHQWKLSDEDFYLWNRYTIPVAEEQINSGLNNALKRSGEIYADKLLKESFLDLLKLYMSDNETLKNEALQAMCRSSLSLEELKQMIQSEMSAIVTDALMEKISACRKK